ncbi:T9SS-dependent M36 family metallopeptidase [Aureisphaera galaxeae]|uniref:T9SS-dependent M36 family metallopeptidase n=1 Tax=Aureisphaera galaxeae TaxID=1538023 RepID=UPI0023501EB4|nr:T9SS-dependent M36 family metallopeptidase [Aureisphaera galaxeae]MDC8005945.1 T9SS-dependent M36 family metallopeptidase [Aureisphaera galaxeae]
MKKLLYLFAFLTVGIAGAQDYAPVIESYMSSNRAAYGLTAQDVEAVSILSHGTSKSMNLENVYANQQYGGIDVFNSTSSFAVRNGQVVYAATPSFVANLASKVNTTSPSLDPEAAINSAVSQLSLSTPTSLELLNVEGNKYLYSGGGISSLEIPVTLVYQPLENNTVRLAWDLSIYLLDSSHYYNVRVDAITGQLLETMDLVVSCDFGPGEHSHSGEAPVESILFKKNAAPQMDLEVADVGEYRVFPIPFRNPDNHGSTNGELVADPDDATASPFGWHDTDGVDGAEFTITRGNNVWAQEDADGNDGTGFAPDGGASLIFDFDYNLPAQPVDFQSAAITNLFYWNNVCHDVTYHYGFDEENGNFQEDNYGNPGNGSDSVNADAQDGSGFNNATFGTPPDGANPRMTMFLWNALITGDILTINEGPLTGPHEGVAAGFGAPIPVPPLTEDIVVVIDDDSGGTSSDPNDACDVITNGTDLNGKIAILNRGSCEFGTKALNAQNAGAIAVIVKYIPTDGGAVYPFEMAPGADGGSVTIPAFLVPEAVGDAIIADINANGPLNGTIDGTNVGGFVDGDLDNEIIIHEYAHGVSNRFTGGPVNVSCLNNTEQMGEGWSDYLALVMTMQTGDTGADIRGLASYASQNPAGIRPTAYSTDMAINGATYGDIGGLSIPHGVGYVWATMLWDMTWAFVDQYGFDPDIYNGTGGNNIAFQLVMDGMKLQVCSPGFVDGRDAILQADQLANAGANQCLIWEVFANRGLGASADQGSAGSVVDGTEAFDLPSECTGGLGDNNFDNNFNIAPNPSNGEINISSIVSLGTTKVSIFDMNGRKVFSQDLELGNRASIDATNLNTGIYIIKIDGGNYSHTSKLIIR